MPQIGEIRKGGEMKIQTLELGNSPQKKDSVFVFNEAHTVIEFILKFNKDELKTLLKRRSN